MWELQLASPLGKIPLRKLLSFVAATLVTIFSYLLLNTTNVSAADAQWNQGSLTYNGDTYRGPTEPTPDHDLPVDTKVYTSLDPQAGDVRVIYFAPSADITTATTANYVTYDQGPTGGLSNKSSPTSITIDETTSAEADVAANQDTSSCKLDGIGWIICPVTNTLAIGMDWIFDIISGFLKVRPLDVNADSTMYKAWSVMRNFANIAFIGAFLVIIYSQLSSFGLSNYGIKRTLPRLILAAVLVNVSYWICAIAIDVFNILGYSLQSIFIGLRNTILGSNSNSWDLVSWESITTFILSGGAIVGAGIAGVSALTTTMAGAFAVGGVGLLLAPILLGAFLTVMVVLFILAARQAIITILVVIAPLAFVAFLLPNTEKWFDKWRSLFMTMLIMFPAFSIIFGGAQLAGILIIQNADDINVVLLGMAVQIAPLAITPLLFKLSGSLLSRIAGVINNPSKGILDRTKNWSKDRLDARRADEMRKNREQAAQGNLSGARNFSRRKALKYDTQRRLREGRKANNEADASSLFLNSDEGRALHEAEFVSKQLKERVDTDVNVALKTRVNTEGSKLHADNVDLELAKTQLKDQEQITAEQMAKYRTEEYLKKKLNPVFSDQTIQTIAGLRHFENEIAINGLAAQGAKRVQDSEFANYMQASGKARERAGSVEGETGAQRALASAMKTQQSAHQEAVSNAGVIIDHGNYKDSQITDLAFNKSGTTGITVTEDIREAAIKRIAGGKNAGELVRLVRDIDIPNLPQDLRQELGDSLLNNSMKPKWLGATTASKIKQGEVDTSGDDRIQTWVKETINANKLGAAETLVGQDPDYLVEVVKTLNNSAMKADMDPDRLVKIKQQIHMAIHDNRYEGRIGEREDAFRSIYNQLPDTDEAEHPNDYERAKKQPPPKPRRT